MVEIHGHCDPAFAAVQDEFQKQLDSGEELGGCITMNVDGKDVVNIWGGYADEAHTKPWEADTIVNVWSTTKTISALATLMLVDRGQLDLNAKVSQYWPEFAAAGKENVEIRHLLSHSSGVAGWDQPVVARDMADLKTANAKLAAQAPWWEPGTASGYHANNYGHLLSEVIYRVTGKYLKQFVAEEIAGPLQADFQIGAVQKDWPRIAPVIPPPQAFDLNALPKDSIPFKVLCGPVGDGNNANTDWWREADMGGINGHGNSRSICRILSTIAQGGEVDGVRILSPKTIDAIFQTQIKGTDLVLGLPVEYGNGFALTEGTAVPWMPQGKKICFWFGWGGSTGIVDVERKTTFAYAMNRMGAGVLGSARTEVYVKAAFEALDEYKE